LNQMTASAADLFKQSLPFRQQRDILKLLHIQMARRAA
jgi:hypothetical protein